MATTTPKSSSSSNASAVARKRSAAAKKAAATRKRNAAQRSTAARKAASSRNGNGSGNGAAPAQAAERALGAVKKAGGPVLAGGAAAAGIAGGVLGGIALGRRARPKRVLGMKLPGTGGLVPHGGLDLKPLAKGIAGAGKRMSEASDTLGKLTEEVDRAGRTAQQVGKILK